MTAGDLRYKVGFYQRGSAGGGSPPPPDYGSAGGYPATATFTTFADIDPQIGGEAVLAGRLSERNFAKITVRQSSQTRAVDPDWKCKDENSGEEYNIRSIIDPKQGEVQHGMWFEMLCEKGVAI